VPCENKLIWVEEIWVKDFRLLENVVDTHWRTPCIPQWIWKCLIGPVVKWCSTFLTGQPKQTAAGQELVYILNFLGKQHADGLNYTYDNRQLCNLGTWVSHFRSINRAVLEKPWNVSARHPRMTDHVCVHMCYRNEIHFYTHARAVSFKTVARDSCHNVNASQNWVPCGQNFPPTEQKMSLKTAYLLSEDSKLF
jgi:hypothetical protein